MNRSTLTKIHLLLAAFIFPVALMFLVTGGLYTWGFKGSYEEQLYDINLDSPLVAEQSDLQAIVERELKLRSIDFPSGGAKIKKIGPSFQLEWTGSRRDVMLAPTQRPLVAKLVVKETTWYRNLVQLHKAKGGQLFKVYAAVLAISLFVILASGSLMAWQVPKYRRMASIAAAAGVGSFLVAIMFS